MINKDYGPTILRIGLGILFFFAGLIKFKNPDAVISMLSNIGFPISVFWAWLLILSEIIFGFLIFIGLKVRYTTIPLMIIMLVAIFTVGIKNTNVLLTNISILFSLIALNILNSGKYSLDFK